MTTHDIQTTQEPWKTETVDEAEYERLLLLGMVYSGDPVAPVADAYDLLFADKIENGTATPAAITDLVGNATEAVDSVNGQTGTVVLTASDVGADASGAAASAQTAAEFYTDGKISAEVTRANAAYDAAGAAAQAQAYAVQRANHTGTQTSGTISDFTEAVQDVVGAQLVAGSNVTVTYDDAAGTTTIDAAGGTGGAVDSVNGQTGAVVLDAADVGAQPAGSYATAAQGGLADTAVQPGDLAEVATTGSYTDLTNKPAIPTAYTDADAVSAVEDAATVAPTGAWDFAQTPTVNGTPVGSGGGGVASTQVSQIVSLTRGDYDALGTKDPATLYLVTGGVATGGTPATSQLVDDFTTTSGLWELVQGAATVTGGNLDLTPEYSADGSGYTTYQSVSSYDLTADSIAIKVAAVPGGNHAADLDFFFGEAVNTNALHLSWESDILYFSYYNGTTVTNVGNSSVDATANPWWRFRHDGTTVYWEVGADGTTYTTLASTPASNLTWPVTSGKAIFYVGYYSGEATVPSHALVAGVNAS